jgi:hypothetical protein
LPEIQRRELERKIEQEQRIAIKTGSAAAGTERERVRERE